MSRRVPLLAAILVEVLAILVFQWKALGVGRVSGGSMAPTLPAGAYMLVNRLDRSPSDGDIVVVRVPWSGRQETFVKRVLASGGETIACCDHAGAVIRNGRPLLEPYVRDDNHQRFCAAGPTDSCPEGAEPVHVPAHHIWLMGDHRSTSVDSRRVTDPRTAAPPASDVQATVIGNYTLAGAYLRLLAYTGIPALPLSLLAFGAASRLTRRAVT